jgi:predicted phosphate transport protein (TIGR00153 family)
LAGFQQAFKEYCAEPDRAQLEQNFSAVHRVESQADDIRREIEVMMYSKALFPESRGDILGLLETIDKIPNQAESVVHMLLTHHIVIPPAFRPSILQLVGICVRCAAALLDGAGKLFVDFTNATVAVGQVDELESEADHLEADLTEQIFSSDIDSIQKILLRDIVKNISSVCDRAENAGDRIRLIAAKRRV